MNNKMKIFYCLALFIILECQSIFTLPTATPRTSPQPVTPAAACDVLAITTCLGNVNYDVFSSLRTSPADFRLFCQRFESSKACVAPYLANGSCSGVEAVGIKAVINGYDYMCSDRGLQVIELLGTCFGNSSAIAGLQQCSADIAKHVDINNLCTLPQFYIQCSLNVSEMYCNKNVSRGLLEFILTFFQSYTEVYNCNYNVPDLGTLPTRKPVSPSWVTRNPFTLRPQTSRPAACSVSAIGQCLSSLSGSNAILPWQRDQVTDIDLDAACMTYNSVKDCYKRATSSCLPLESIQYDLFISMYEYVCTPSGKQQYRSLYECFANEEVRSQMSQCGNANGLDLSDHCSFPNHFISCADNVSRDYCNSSPALPAIVRASFKPYQTALNCDLTPDDDTPTTSMPRLCSTTALVKCLRNMTTSAIFPWQKGTSVSVNNVDIGETCSALESAQDCYYKEVNYCDAKVSLDTDLLMSMYTYVCSAEGQKDYRSARECYNNQEALSSMTKCGDVSGVDVSDYCNVPKHFMRCADEASRNCSSALTNIVKASFKPYETAFSCDLSDDADRNSYPSHSGNLLIITTLMMFTAVFL